MHDFSSPCPFAQAKLSLCSCTRFVFLAPRPAYMQRVIAAIFMCAFRALSIKQSVHRYYPVFNGIIAILLLSCTILYMGVFTTRPSLAVAVLGVIQRLRELHSENLAAIGASRKQPILKIKKKLCAHMRTCWHWCAHPAMCPIDYNNNANNYESRQETK